MKGCDALRHVAGGEGSPIYVAAGGGGDAVGALMLGLLNGKLPNEIAVASFAWERKLFDPRPGPRNPADFRGLRAVGRQNHLVTSDTSLHRGTSFLPQLVRQFGCQLYLLDPARGCVGLTRQLEELRELHHGAPLELVDVGGDVLAQGHEPGLRSPLADGLALAATCAVDRTAKVVVLGIGLDGELTLEECDRALCELADPAALPSRPLTAAIAQRVARAFDWLPSEATGMTCLAVMGHVGIAEIRADGLLVRLSRGSAEIHCRPATRVFKRNHLARLIVGSRSLGEAEQAISVAGTRPESLVEATAIKRRRGRVGPIAYSSSELDSWLLRYSDRAKRRGVDYVSLRRLGEVLGISCSAWPTFTSLLRRRHAERVVLSAWRC